MVKDNGEESFFLKKKKKHAILRPEPGSGSEGGGLFLKAQVTLRAWGPFLESPGNFTGPKSNIQIEI